MKVMIAVPTYETITPDTFKAIYDLAPAGAALSFEYVRGYDVATARNRIAKKALEAGADYVLMVDNDVTPPRDALRNLLEDDGDVVLGYYARRGNDNLYDGKSTLSKLGEYNYTYEFLYTAEELRQLRERGEHRIEVHGGGLGCALIRTEVFRKMKAPWFKWVHYEGGGNLSEDLYFCSACGRAEIPVYADTRVACGHLLRHIQGV